MLIHGWGRYPIAHTVEHAPDTRAGMLDAMHGTKGLLLARGMGRSYGDSALSSQVLSTRRLAWLLSFDAGQGLLQCASGATLDDILNVFVPRGWFLPVTPGTRFISVGGAIASDVHGKNHHRLGCFSNAVVELELMLGDGTTLVCSPTRHAELFHATCGGMGLTGVILQATLRLQPITSAYIEQTTYKARNLAHAIALFESRRDATYSVAWLDCITSGKALGRALITTGEHAADGRLDNPLPPSLPMPIDMPGMLLNRYSIGAFNALYYARQRKAQQNAAVHYQPFFYPLDRILNWNRLYGRKGFIQYQCVIPHGAAQGLHVLLQRIAASGRGSFLGVLKEFGAANNNPLSFPMPGYTLALDFKMSSGLLPLLDELDAIVLDHGGRLYLAKDARMTEATFKRGYPRWEMFQQIRERYHALGRFASLQSRRLGLE